MSDADDGVPFDAWSRGEGDVHPEDTRWTKHTQDTMARIISPVLGSRFEPSLGDEMTTRMELLEVARPKVSIAIAVDVITEDGAEVDLDVTARLSPSQAEALAKSLYENAEAAREYQEDKDD